MLKTCSSRPLLLAALVVATCPAFAQSAEKAKPGASIAGKASASKATPSKATPERKRYEFTGAEASAAAAATQAAGSHATPAAPAAVKDKSHCHSSASDA